MAGGKLKELYDFFRNPGEQTVNPTVRYHGDKTVWTIGRSADSDFVYTAPKISRRHCRIELIDGHYYLSDVGSTNGTYLNGTRIERKERLFSGDIISIGSEDIVFTKDMLF